MPPERGIRAAIFLGVILDDQTREKSPDDHIEAPAV